MTITAVSTGEPPWTATLAELTLAERLIVRVLRRWLAGLCENSGRHWTQAWNDCAKQLGPPDGREAVAGLAETVAALQCAARRRFRYHHPCCACLGADEMAFVCLVTACRQNPPRARALAEWLVTPDRAACLVRGGERLARALERHLPAPPERGQAAASSRGRPVLTAAGRRPG